MSKFYTVLTPTRKRPKQYPVHTCAVCGTGPRSVQKEDGVGWVCFQCQERKRPGPCVPIQPTIPRYQLNVQKSRGREVLANQIRRVC